MILAEKDFQTLVVVPEETLEKLAPKAWERVVSAGRTGTQYPESPDIRLAVSLGDLAFERAVESGPSPETVVLDGQVDDLLEEIYRKHRLIVDLVALDESDNRSESVPQNTRYVWALSSRHWRDEDDHLRQAQRAGFKFRLGCVWNHNH